MLSMNIKTITCHHVYNYGATLQAYALQEYLESIGHDVEIIDYRLPSQTRYQLFMPYPKGKIYEIIKKFPWLRYILCPYRNRKMLYTWGRKKAFDKFDAEHLNITSVTYHTIEEIRKNPPAADIYIAGSDQIWNTDSANGIDFGYYLDFGDKNIKRISYAASFGVNKIKNDLKNFVANELCKFDKISVRETTGLKILNEFGLNGTLVVDPVFLLSKEQWITSFNLKSNNVEKYILLYDFLHDDPNLRNFAKSLSSQTGLRLLSVNDISKASYADIQINNAGPTDFLQYILNAEYIISNSFHATAFSIIFHKEFVTFSLISQNNSSRMSDLLEDLKLTERLCPQSINVLNNLVNWDKVENCLSQKIMHSKKFLEYSIY